MHEGPQAAYVQISSIQYNQHEQSNRWASRVVGECSEGASDSSNTKIALLMSHNDELCFCSANDCVSTSRWQGRERRD